LQATLQIYSPRHDNPMYEVNLPVYEPSIEESYWVGFCLRGGRGINNHGVTVADPKALFLNKPAVGSQCILDKQHVGTISIAQPENVEAKTLTPDAVELTWGEPTETGGDPITRYRIFVLEKGSAGSPLKIDTLNAKTNYQLKTPKFMWGKEYTFMIQAINKNSKMSLLSDPAIFKVGNPDNADKTAEPKQVDHSPKMA
jgi:hypothetical protein